MKACVSGFALRPKSQLDETKVAAQSGLGLSVGASKKVINTMCRVRHRKTFSRKKGNWPKLDMDRVCWGARLFCVALPSIMSTAGTPTKTLSVETAAIGNRH